MNSKDMINNVNSMQDNIDSNTARYNQLNTDVDERKTTIDTIQGKVKELSQKEYNVKVNIVNAMNTKGLSASTDDSYDTLANKLKTIDNTATMYSYAMQVTYSYNVPNNASYGDIWIPLEGSNYKLVFTDSTDSITSPSANEIYLTYNDAILEINFDTSINNYTTSSAPKLNLQIPSNTFIDNISDNYIPVILSELNRYLVKPKATYKYSSTFTEFESFWYNGRGWKPINYKRNPNLVLYGVNNSRNILAMDKDTLSNVWNNNSAFSGDLNRYYNYAAGLNLVAIVRNTTGANSNNYVSFIDMKGSTIKTHSFQCHANQDPYSQYVRYCSYNNCFYVLRNISSSSGRIFKYNGSTGEEISNKLIQYNGYKNIITCIGNKLFLSQSNTDKVETVEVDVDTLDIVTTHTLPSLRRHTTYQNYIFIVNYNTTSTTTTIDKYQYINGSFNLIKSATITTKDGSAYKKITMASNPTNHTPYVILGYGYDSGGYVILDTNLNEVSRVTNSVISMTYRGDACGVVSSLGDGRLAYSLDYAGSGLGYIGIFNLFNGNNNVVLNAQSTSYQSILLGTTTGLLNDFPYEY